MCAVLPRCVCTFVCVCACVYLCICVTLCAMERNIHSQCMCLSCVYVYGVCACVCVGVCMCVVLCSTDCFSKFETQLSVAVFAVCCSVLQCVTVCCNCCSVVCGAVRIDSCSRIGQEELLSSSHTASHCNTLQHTATHCNTLQHSTHDRRSCSRVLFCEKLASNISGRLWRLRYMCSVLQCVAVCCSVLQCVAVCTKV